MKKFICKLAALSFAMVIVGFFIGYSYTILSFRQAKAESAKIDQTILKEANGPESAKADKTEEDEQELVDSQGKE